MKLDLKQASWICLMCLALAVTSAHEGWSLTIGAGAPIEFGSIPRKENDIERAARSASIARPDGSTPSGTGS